MPIFPDKYDNVEVFRLWWKSVAKFCARKTAFECAEFIFAALCGYPNQITNPLEIT